MALIRISAVLVETGTSRSKLYADVTSGLFTRPVKLGPRASGFPSSEVKAIVDARIAGFSEDQIRSLVKRLEAARIQAVA